MVSKGAQLINIFIYLQPTTDKLAPIFFCFNGFQSSVGFLVRHLTWGGISKMAETMYAQLLRFSEQANFVRADRKILDAKIYQFTNQRSNKVPDKVDFPF